MASAPGSSRFAAEVEHGQRIGVALAAEQLFGGNTPVAEELVADLLAAGDPRNWSPQEYRPQMMMAATGHFRPPRDEDFYLNPSKILRQTVKVLVAAGHHEAVARYLLSNKQEAWSGILKDGQVDARDIAALLPLLIGQSKAVKPGVVADLCALCEYPASVAQEYVPFPGLDAPGWPIHDLAEVGDAVVVRSIVLRELRPPRTEPANDQRRTFSWRSWFPRQERTGQLGLPDVRLPGAAEIFQALVQLQDRTRAAKLFAAWFALRAAQADWDALFALALPDTDHLGDSIGSVSAQVLAPFLLACEGAKASEGLELLKAHQDFLALAGIVAQSHEAPKARAAALVQLRDWGVLSGAPADVQTLQEYVGILECRPANEPRHDLGGGHGAAPRRDGQRAVARCSAVAARFVHRRVPPVCGVDRRASAHGADGTALDGGDSPRARHGREADGGGDRCHRPRGARAPVLGGREGTAAPDCRGDCEPPGASPRSVSHQGAV